jgi:hypothetical protein
MKRARTPFPIMTSAALAFLASCVSQEPLEIKSVLWCVEPESSLKVTARITSRSKVDPVESFAIQAKVFPAGGAEPILPEVFEYPDAEGRLMARLKPHDQLPGSFAINLCYQHPGGSTDREGKWFCRDFKQGQPRPCAQQ